MYNVNSPFGSPKFFLQRLCSVIIIFKCKVLKFMLGNTFYHSVLYRDISISKTIETKTSVEYEFWSVLFISYVRVISSKLYKNNIGTRVELPYCTLNLCTILYKNNIGTRVELPYCTLNLCTILYMNNINTPVEVPYCILYLCTLLYMNNICKPVELPYCILHLCTLLYMNNICTPVELSYCTVFYTCAILYT